MTRLSLALCVAVPLVIWHFFKSRRALPLPPGPPRKLFAGNLRDWPQIKPWLGFMEMAKKYGDLISLQVLNRRIVVLSSAKAATELLNSRANIYSDRPHTWMLSHLAGQAESMFVMSSLDQRFPTYRKMLAAGMNRRAVVSPAYRRVVEARLCALLRGLAQLADDDKSEEAAGQLVQLLSAYSGGIALKIAYGYDVTEPTSQDYFVDLINRADDAIPSLIIPFYFVEIFPFLRFLPKWLSFHRIAAEKKKILDAMAYVPYEWAKKQIQTGSPEPSFFSQHYLSRDEPLTAADENTLMWTSSSMYNGAAHTTTAVITTFFLVMSTHPDVQKAAQAEIDQLTEYARLVSSDDRAAGALPYITAIMKEVLRWAPVAPLGLRHRVTQDDIYEGYLIPKGSIVVANIWAITHDPELYPDPSKFDPSRFIGDSPQRDPFDFAFGFGRRVCPGEKLAQETIYLAFANTLALFDISPALDAAGKDVDPMEALDWRTGIVTLATNFGFRLTPRSKEALALAEA
ncbi:Cytochrome P450 [Mycena kentingensis (nom. inval.)]|nr:Cytochrome P450 [Mycena kentingensis (nom. inval.)]